MKKLKVIAAIVLLGFLGVYFYRYYTRANPFDQVEWIQETPGATERYVTFTPVLKANKKPIGPTVGADYAALTFKDLDDDGIKEAIIETNPSIHLEFYHSERHVLKFKTDEITGPKFEYSEGPELNKK